jgi:hypothetical protein
LCGYLNRAYAFLSAVIEILSEAFVDSSWPRQTANNALERRKSFINMAPEPEAPATSSSAAHVDAGEEQSAISELQCAFPTLLTLERAKTGVLTTWAWTGFFAFLAFPRELRELVYFHYLSRPKALAWQRCPNGGRERHIYLGRYFTIYREKIAQELLNLFLVSRQVYTEALPVFCRANAITVAPRNSRRNSTLQNSLRLFPDSAARHLRHVEVRYPDTYGRRECTRETWARIVADAVVARQHFPLLATYTALWEVDWRAFYGDEPGMVGLQTASVEVRVDLWRCWLRREEEERGTVPPAWVRVRLEASPRAYERWPENRAEVQPLEMALEVFQGEARGRRVEGEELEGSGRKWLEEEWGVGRRDRREKGKGKSVG